MPDNFSPQSDKSNPGFDIIGRVIGHTDYSDESEDNFTRKRHHRKTNSPEEHLTATGT